jgi:hypothetical protein
VEHVDHVDHNTGRPGESQDDMSDSFRILNPLADMGSIVPTHFEGNPALALNLRRGLQDYLLGRGDFLPEMNWRVRNA